MIDFENVGLRYGLGREVLSDMTFRINPGSFQFLTGSSGAGKTSLLRLMLMAIDPSRGRIRLFGKETSQLSKREMPFIRRKLGVVFQDFRLLDHLTTYENVALPLRVQGKTDASYRSDVTDLLQWVGLGERVHAHPPVLSGGNAGSHRIDGTAAGFVPPQFDRAIVTDVMALPEEEARQMARRLARDEGIFAGTSTGMNVLAALRIASNLGPGHVVATVACDTGFKYLNGDLYQSSNG